MSVVTALHWT